MTFGLPPPSDVVLGLPPPMAVKPELPPPGAPPGLPPLSEAGPDDNGGSAPMAGGPSVNGTPPLPRFVGPVKARSPTRSSAGDPLLILIGVTDASCGAEAVSPPPASESPKASGACARDARRVRGNRSGTAASSGLWTENLAGGAPAVTSLRADNAGTVLVSARSGPYPAITHPCVAKNPNSSTTSRSLAVLAFIGTRRRASWKDPNYGEFTGPRTGSQVLELLAHNRFRAEMCPDPGAASGRALKCEVYACSGMCLSGLCREGRCYD